MSILSINNLHVEVEDLQVLKGINLAIPQGEVHAIMGPNATGKSTLAYSIMGHPRYSVTKGDITIDDLSILSFLPEERAYSGIFMAFQYPVAIPGVSVANFLRTALNAQRRHLGKESNGLTISEFRKMMLEKMQILEINPSMASRYLNDGFSGGEKKRIEILQMALLQPKFAILDETDSGLDIDALRIVAEGINTLKNPNLGILVITHYQRILNYLKPDFVHVMVDGQIVKSGHADLALELEKEGYEKIQAKYHRDDK